MAVIPVRLLPLPGEALDSWLETYAQVLHVADRDILALAGLRWDRAATVNGRKPWVVHLDERALSALSAVCGIPGTVLADMTLARYEGTSLAVAGPALPGRSRAGRWQTQPSGSRYCPRCLAGNGGRWMLTWRIPWTFACTAHQVLLACTCPGCGRRHPSTRTGQPRPLRCDLSGLPLPPPGPPRGRAPCTSDPAAAPVATLPGGGRVLNAQQHINDLIAAQLAARDDPARPAARELLDDIGTVARAAIAAIRGPATPPAAVSAVLAELGERTGIPGSATAEAFAGLARGMARQSAPLAAFGAAIASIMLHDRHDDPDPVITAWLAGTAASRGKKTSPADTLSPWGNASTVLKTALAEQLQPLLGTVSQLRQGIPAGSAPVPDPARAQARAAAMPPLLWPGWALRLMPPGDFSAVSYRGALSVLLMIASGGASDYRTAQELLGQHPAQYGRTSAAFLTGLREHAILDPVLAAICQLARSIDEHGSPIGYARRRQLPSLAQAQLDADGWNRQRNLLPGSWSWKPRTSRTTGGGMPAVSLREHFARFRLIELLTGIHPCYLPGPVHLTRCQGRDYSEFLFTLPAPMARFLNQNARCLLDYAGIGEPISWEPPAGWVTGITWPGPDPASITPAGLHPLLQSGLPASTIAIRLGTTISHVRLAATLHPAPQPLSWRAARAAPRPEPPGTGQLRALTEQGLRPRTIARITGCSEHAISRALAESGLLQAASSSSNIDPHWLRQQYQEQRRSLTGIATGTGIPAKDLADAARNAGIPLRRGINSCDHPLASLGGPGAFTPATWNAFTRPHAEQRRLLLQEHSCPSAGRREILARPSIRSG